MLDSIRYLGVTFDARLSCKARPTNAGPRALNGAGANAGIMIHIGGPKQPRRFFLSSVIISVIMLRVPIWGDTMNTYNRYRAASQLTHRIVALRAACVHTASVIALSVVAGFPHF